LPVALMEACAASLPIIANNVGGVSEVAIDTVNAFLTQEATVRSLSERIYEFIELDENKRADYSQASLKIFKREYILEKNLKEKYDYIFSLNLI